MIQSNESFFMVSGFPDIHAQGFNQESFIQLFRDKNAIVSAQSSNIQYDKHWGALSIKFAWNGIETYHTHHTSYAVKQDNFLILNQDTIYASSIASDKPVDSFTISFHDRFIAGYIASLSNNPDRVLEPLQEHDTTIRFAERTYQADPKIQAIMHQMYQLSHASVIQTELIDELFYALFGQMVVINKDILEQVNRVSKIRKSTREEIFRRLEYARDFIEYGYADSLNLQQIAGVACMNTEYFIRQFKSLYGCSPIQYLIRKRLTEARSMLNNMDMSVQEVCRRVGYEDPSSFGKLFRRYFRVNPKSYQLKEMEENRLVMNVC